jgi:hypothetical protein
MIPSPVCLIAVPVAREKNNTTNDSCTIVINHLTWDWSLAHTIFGDCTSLRKGGREIGWIRTIKVLADTYQRANSLYATGKYTHSLYATDSTCHRHQKIYLYATQWHTRNEYKIWWHTRNFLQINAGPAIDQDKNEGGGSESHDASNVDLTGQITGGGTGRWRSGGDMCLKP